MYYFPGLVLVVSKLFGSVPSLNVLFGFFFCDPFLGVREWVFLFSNNFVQLLPLGCQVGIPLGIVSVLFGKLIIGVDRFDRTNRYACVTIDAFLRVNHEEIWAFIKTVDRANLHTVGVFAVDTGLGYDVWHGSLI